MHIKKYFKLKYKNEELLIFGSVLFLSEVISFDVTNLSIYLISFIKRKETLINTLFYATLHSERLNL